MIKEVDVAAQGDLVVDQETLKKAGLGGHLRLIIKKGKFASCPRPRSIRK